MKDCDKLIKKIESNYYIVGIRADNIVHVFYKDNTKIDITLLHDLVNSFNEITNSEKKCFIFEPGKNVSMSNEARNYTFKLENKAPFKASVIVTENLFYKLLAEFFYYIKKPKTPYNIFTKFEDGIAWLQNIK